MCIENFTYAKKFYVHEIAAVNLSKIYFLKNAKKTCKPNNRDLNRDWIIILKKIMALHYIMTIQTLTFTRTVSSITQLQKQIKDLHKISNRWQKSYKVHMKHKEAAIRDVLWWKCSLKFRKIQLKASVSDFFLHRVAGLKVIVYKLFLNENLSTAECFIWDAPLIQKTNLKQVNIDEITGNHFDFNVVNSIANK